jgi:hypothetical protein
MSYLLRSLQFGFFFGLVLVLVASPAVWSQDDSADPVEDAEDSSDADASRMGKSLFWTVDFESKGLRMISPERGIGARRVFWYMLYELSNPSDEDRQLFVNITATSDHNKRYADLFLPSVERAIEKKERRVLWGKVDQFMLIRKRKPKDPKYNYITLKAREKRFCVAVFNRLDPNANHITISVSGLSNEIRESIADDGTRLLGEGMREFYFKRAGDEHDITLDSFKPAGRAWTRREIPAPRSNGRGQ